MNKNFEKLPWERRIDGSLITKATKNFWDYYNCDKQNAKAEGFKVIKDEDGWYVVYYDYLDLSKKRNFIKKEPDVEKARDEIVEYKIKELKYKDNLREYQRAHALHVLNVLNNVGYYIDGSSCGVGKTFLTLVVCKELGIKPLIICPKTIIYSWINAAKMLGVEIVDVINYEKIKFGNTEFLEKKGNKFIWNKDIDIIVYDEAHRLKNYKTVNAKMAIASKKQNKKIILLSATIADSPLDFGAVGYICELFEKQSDYYWWMFKHGVKKNSFGYLFFDGNITALQKLRMNKKESQML